MSDELELVKAWRRYIEHLAGKHNQKSHGNKYGSTDAIKGNVKRLGKDKEALKRMAARARGDKEFQGKVKAGAQAKKDARKSSNKAGWSKNANGEGLHAEGKEKYVVSLSDGFANASRATASIEPPNSEGKVWARISVGNKSDGRYFDSVDEAKSFLDKFINPTGDRALSTHVKKNGKVMVSKYDGTDIYGKKFTAGTRIYYYRNTKGSGNTTHMLPVD